MQKMKSRRLFVPVCMDRRRREGNKKAWKHDPFLWRCLKTLFLWQMLVPVLSRTVKGTREQSCVLGDVAGSEQGAHRVPRETGPESRKGD